MTFYFINYRAILKTGHLTYKDSGVDIVAGDSLVHHIKPLAKSTNRVGSMGSIGGFGGLFDVKAAGYEDPILVSGTDGVGTKLKVRRFLIGIVFIFIMALFLN